MNRFHWPFQLGYFESSNACAPATHSNNAVSAVATTRLRLGTAFLPASLPRRSNGACGFGRKKLMPADVMTPAKAGLRHILPPVLLKSVRQFPDAVQGARTAAPPCRPSCCPSLEAEP